MYASKIQTALLVLCLLHSANSQSDDSRQADYKIVCYYTNWAQYRPEPARYTPENIDPSLCTHIIFAFAKINAQHQLSAYEWNDESTAWSVGMYQKVVSLKNKNPKLKVLLAVGGWNQGSLAFSDMTRNNTKRTSFINGTISFLLDHKFDGLDLDWEYPASRDTVNRPDDKKSFTILCKDLKSAFRPFNFMLTAAVAVGEKTIKVAYDIPSIHKYLDFISLMAYGLTDLHGAWENVTGHNAPLYPRALDKDKTLNIDWAVETWLSYGVPKEKLILGLAFYGRSFKLEQGFDSCPITDTPVVEGGKMGDYTREKGFLAYYEVCEKLQVNSWRYVWNEEQEVPFAYTNEARAKESSLDWVGFDDVNSIEIKVKYLMDKGLGGAMIWSIDMDDFNGDFCNQDKYPLLKTVNFYLNPRKAIKKMPDASLNWVNRANFSHEIMETIHPSRRNENDFIVNYNHEKLDEISFFRTFNVFNLMKNDVLHIYKFCQCKSGIQRVAPHNADEFTKGIYTLVVDCDKKALTSEKMAKNENNAETDGHEALFSFKRSFAFCFVSVLLALHV